MEPRRIQLKSKKDWKMPANTMSVANPAKWANHYAWWARGGYAAAAEMFRDYIMRRPRLIEAAKHELRGKNLACWCPLNKPCHADVLLALANTPGSRISKERHHMQMKRSYKDSRSKQKTITHSELSRLTFCNSEKIPLAVNHDGVRKVWVGIGWIEDGKLRGDEVLVIDK
ncbi:MAG: DUF4326 domain-containing protein [Candidatus Binatia bacterium]